MADPLITKKITDVQQFAENRGTILQVQNSQLGQTPIDTMKDEIKTDVVAQLLSEGGVSLGVVNIKGTVASYADLTLITDAKVNDAYEVEDESLFYVWDGTTWVGGFNLMPEPIGIVAEGNTQAVSGNEIATTTKVSYKWNSSKTRVVGDWVERSGKIYVVIEDTNENPNVSNKYVLLNEDKYRIGFMNNKSSDVLINETNNTITFKTGISVVRGDGRFTTTTDFNFNYVNNPYVIWFNIETLNFEINLQTDVSRYKNEKYSIIGVFRVNNGSVFLNGITNYTINGIEIPNSLYASASTDFNRLFKKYNVSRTLSEKKILDECIIDIEFYNIESPSTVHIYRIGKNWTSNNMSYLSFVKKNYPSGSNFIYADEFNNTDSQPYDPNLHSGIKTYTLRVGSDKSNDKTIIGQVTINWDKIPNGLRIGEPNANTQDNTEFLSNINKYSSKYNLTFNNLEFSKSLSFYDYFNSPEIASYASGISNMIPKDNYWQVETWLAKWDEMLVNKPLGYTVTKDVVTLDAPTDLTPTNKFPIYGYSFKPSLLNFGDQSDSNVQILPKIFITCGIHGFEKITSFVVYEFIQQMFNNWKSHSFLEYCRFNLEIVIVPICNPHGWQVGDGVGTRVNFNGVDLNRNFPVGWKFGNEGTSTYSGPSSASEIETQTLVSFMQSKITNNTVMAFDFHNFHGVVESNPKDYDLCWIINHNSYKAMSANNVLVKELSVKYKEKSALIPQDEDYYIGVSNSFTVGGWTSTTIRQIAPRYAGTLEVAQNFRFNPNYQGYDKDAMTFGMETFVNYLRVYINAFT